MAASLLGGLSPGRLGRVEERVKEYKRPRLTEWGTVTQLTAAGLKGGTSDGFSKFSVTPPGQEKMLP